MKNFKALLVAFLLVCTASANAQSLDSKGFTVQSYLGMYMEGEELMSYDCNEVYNVSIKDGFLVHNILTDGIVTDSQMYKISNLKSSEKDGETTFAFDATSGISGKIYKYSISFGGEGSVTLTLTQADGSATIFMATSAIFKTFKQQ